MHKKIKQLLRSNFSSQNQFASKKPFYFILGANISLFGLYYSEVFDQRFFDNHFKYDPKRPTDIYTSISSGFFHTNIFELGFNMALFINYAPKLMSQFSSNHLIKLYFLGLISGVLCTQVLTELGYYSADKVYGAGSGVNAIVAQYICAFPRDRIIQFLPIPNWSLGLLLFYWTYNILDLDPTLFGGLFGGAFAFWF